MTSLRSDRRALRIGVAIFSYDGGLTFGVTSDYDNAADIDVLCKGIEQSMRELLAAAERARPADRVDQPLSAPAGG